MNLRLKVVFGILGNEIGLYLKKVGDPVTIKQNVILLEVDLQVLRK